MVRSVIKGTTAELIPYAAQSKTAQQILLGMYNANTGQGVPSFNALKGVVGNTKDAQNGLAAATEAVTGKMSDLNQLVQNLSSTMQGDAMNAIAGARVGFLNLGDATTKYYQDVQKAGVNSTQASQDMRGLDSQLYSLGFTTADVAAMNEKLGGAFGLSKTQAQALANQGLREVTNQAHAATAALKGIPRTIEVHIGMQGEGNATINVDGPFGGTRSSGTYGSTISGTTAHMQAAGGLIHGEGTSTSDSNLAYLSTGEYVVKAAAVDHYGAGFFHAANAMKLAGGGLVESGNMSVLSGQFGMQMLSAMVNALRQVMMTLLTRA